MDHSFNVTCLDRRRYLSYYLTSLQLGQTIFFLHKIHQFTSIRVLHNQADVVFEDECLL